MFVEIRNIMMLQILNFFNIDEIKKKDCTKFNDLLDDFSICSIEKFSKNNFEFKLF